MKVVKLICFLLLLLNSLIFSFDSQKGEMLSMSHTRTSNIYLTNIPMDKENKYFFSFLLQ